MSLPSNKTLLFLFLFLSLVFSFSTAVTNSGATTATIDPEQFKEAPEFNNYPTCPSFLNTSSDSNSEDDSDSGAAAADVICSETAVHVAMTLDAAYIRGFTEAILSACPRNMIFHFVYSVTTHDASLLRSTVSSSLPKLHFQLHPSDASAVSATKQK